MEVPCLKLGVSSGLIPQALSMVGIKKASTWLAFFVHKWLA
jgi:hypothetical protein